jgi:transaldolase
MATDGGDFEARLQRYAAAGIDVEALAQRLQDEGAKSFVKSWNQLLERIATKAGTLSSGAASSGKAS